MTEPSSLLDVRAIETVKARYCRLLDTKDWSGFRAVFADDFLSDTTASGGKVIDGADAFVAFVSRTLATAVTVHQVQQPEIDLTSDTTANGVWAMQDVVRFAPGITMHGFGHYVETYEKREGQWVIRSSTLTRLRMELQTPILSVFVSERLQRRMQQASRRWVR